MKESTRSLRLSEERMGPRTEPEGGRCLLVGGEMFAEVQKGSSPQSGGGGGMVTGRGGKGKKEEETVSNVSTVKKKSR